ncbi:hypothetical protein [Bacillus salipaludis]|uniref:FeoB-associated Cys-rich membrane protein n=1 Tax=Bacillus salipaludis TaxID=2547811 RepID=A0ABW8RQ13_9BACI
MSTGVFGFPKTEAAKSHGDGSCGPCGICVPGPCGLICYYLQLSNNIKLSYNSRYINL